MSTHLTSHRRSPAGTHRASPSRQIYERVTNAIVTALEAGVIPWRSISDSLPILAAKSCSRISGEVSTSTRVSPSCPRRVTKIEQLTDAVGALSVDLGDDDVTALEAAYHPRVPAGFQ